VTQWLKPEKQQYSYSVGYTHLFSEMFFHLCCFREFGMKQVDHRVEPHVCWWLSIFLLVKSITWATWKPAAWTWSKLLRNYPTSTEKVEISNDKGSNHGHGSKIYMGPKKWMVEDKKTLRHWPKV
jgi:hypothetical protein